MYNSNNFFVEVSRGSRLGMTNVVFSGSNGDVDAAEDMWAVGGDAPAFNGTGDLLEVLSSDNTNDKAAGTGALTVRVSGVSILGVPQTADVILNGTSAVAIPTTLWGFVNRVEVLTAGSGLTNAGTITVRIVSAGATKITMPIGYGTSDAAFYYVPASYRLIVTELSLFALTAGLITFGLVTVSGGVAKTQAFAGIASAGETIRPYVAINGSTLVKVRALAVSTTNQSCGASLRGVLMSADAV
jgi:hypothetical protein